jgi:ribonucleoside-diphosphate reductase alpha chain
MRFDLRFATSVTDPLAGVEFSAQRSEIKREDGSFVFEMDIRAPKNWSQTAVDMLAQKYARKAGVPSETVAVPEAHVPYWLQPQQAAPGATFGPETDAEKIFRRLAGCWTYWGWKGGYFDTEADARNFYADTLFCLATQKFAPNTPQWLNCFSGRQKIITKEFGVAAFAELVDEKLHVWTRQGWKEAEVRCFGPQLLRRVTMAPAFKLSSGSWSAGKTNMRRAVEVTADHRWIMTDGSHSTELKVGDSVLAASVQPDEVSDDYRAGLQHGVIFGDGTAHYQHKTSQLRRYQVNLYGAKTELARHFPTASAPPFLAAAGGVQAAVVSADNLKEFPLPGRSPDYMAGFLDGWLATDGNKKSTNSYRLSTVNPAAGAWLEEFAAYAGWLLVGHSVEVQTKPIVINGKETKRSGPQHCFTLARHDRAWKVTEIVDLEMPEEVFCAVVPEAGEFTLAEGILTGNCGLAWAYGIKSDDTGQFGFDGASRDIPFQLVKDIDQYSRPASGACFIMKLADNLVGPDGITDLIAREARVFRAGSGSGANYSDIRGLNEPLSGGGKSSGLASFLNPIDRSAGAIKSGGTSRRAARMVVLDMDHPDVEWFINWKADEEKKVAALAAGSKILKAACEACHAAATAKNEALLTAKAAEAVALGVPAGTIDGVVRAARQGLPCPRIPHYDAGYEGKGYQSIEGQNANNSVRVTDAFMRAVKADADWHLYWRTELRKAKAEGRKPKPCKTLKARALWRQVCLAAWDCADPGVQFHDTINAWHTCPEDGDIRATNPCSEYNWLDDTTCNLASVNVCSFYDVEQDAYDWKGLEDMAELVTTILDITVGMSSYPTAPVAENAAKYRTLGMGPMNVGALLMRMGLPYDSDAGRGMAVTVMGLIHLAAMRTSCTMAEKLGTFPRWEPNRWHVQRVMVHHIDYCRGYRPKTANAPEAPATILAAAGTAERLAEAAGLTEQVLADAGWKMRNAQLTLAAPTGCLVAGSMVITDTGLRRIERLGDPDGPRWQDLQTRVATDDGPRDATKFFVNGVDDVIRVRTASGQTISGTPRHRIKVVDPDGNWVWRCFAELGIGDVIPTMLGGMLGEPRPVNLPACPAPYGPSVRRAVKTPVVMTETLAELVGLFHGEGSLHAKGLRFALTAGDADLIEWCLATCRDLFGADGTVTNHGGYVTVEMSSTQVAAWWVSCGFAKERADGKSGKGYVCRIPEAILDTNDALVYAAYARGLFSGDGTANGGTPSISNKSDDFLDELQTLLAVLGIRSTRSAFTGGMSRRPVYRLSIGSRRHTAIFVEKIGFRPKRKAAILNTADDGDDRSDRIPVPAELMRAVCPVGSPERECLNRYLRRCNSVPRRFAETMAAREPRIARYLGYGYSKVVEAELVGRAPTFDLSVPDNVTYVANGFVSHNTIGLVTDCDTTGIEPDFALVKTKKLAGGGYLKFVNQSVGPALLRLGYSDMQAEEICTFVQQRQTIEGAPHLKDEHLPVFDCANKCGKEGKRFIPAMGHVRMLAAIHPVISGSASKTVNLPPDATLADVTEIYEESHRTGVKCVALYRDGSKLSQPLTSGLSFDAGDPTVAAQTDPTPAPAPQRRKLPNRRNGHTQKVRIGGQKVYIRTGEYEDGTLGEIFVDIDKEGSTLRGVMNTLAKAISIALQHGVPLEEYVDALRYTKFEPHGPVGGHDTIKMASSIVDMIARHLADAYLGDASGTHVQPYPPPGRAPAEDNPATQAVLQGFKSTPCPNCREYKLVQGGKCDVCKNCGHQGGCS